MKKIYNGKNEQDVRETLINSGVTILVGEPGSGKSSTVLTVLKEFEALGVVSSPASQEMKSLLKVKDTICAIFHSGKEDVYKQHGFPTKVSGLKEHFILLMEEFKPDSNMPHKPKAIVVLDGADGLPEWSNFVKSGEFRTVLGSARSMGIQVVVVLSEGDRGSHFIKANVRTLAVFKSSESDYNYYMVKPEDRNLTLGTGDYVFNSNF